MKNFNRLFRIVALATVLSLLAAALPAMPALAASVSLHPNEGEIGARIDITGSGFPESFEGTAPTYSDAYDRFVYIYFSPEEATTSDYVSDLDTYYRVKTIYTDTYGDIDTHFTVPTRLTDGDVDKDVRGGTYYVYTATTAKGRIKTVDSFTVIAAEITLDHDKGTVGTKVKITGKDFKDKEAITVEYDSNTIDIGTKKTSSSGGFSQDISIPESTAGDHTITVTDKSGSEAEASFTVVPEISASTATGSPGDSITISGTGFGQDAEVTIKFDGVKITTGNANSDGTFQLSLAVPVKVPGSYNLEARDDDGNKDSVSFTIRAKVKLGQATGNVGATATISGNGFKPNAQVTISYDAASAPVTTTITSTNGEFSATFTIPGSKAGQHIITATDGTNAATTTFTMEATPPAIPQPLVPEQEAKAKSLALFDWGDVADPSGVTYTLQIATNKNFANPVLEKTGLTESEYTLTKEERLKSTKKDAPYYWRIRATDGAGNQSDWTTPGSFRVGLAFDLSSGWVLYTLMGLASLMLLAIGYLLGRRTAYW